MRIVWKDSQTHGRTRTELKYRGFKTELYGDGWIINIPGDNNIYYPRDCALNAIDKYLGGYGQKGRALRHDIGIRTIGKVDDVS